MMAATQQGHSRLMQFKSGGGIQTKADQHNSSLDHQMATQDSNFSGSISKHRSKNRSDKSLDQELPHNLSFEDIEKMDDSQAMQVRRQKLKMLSLPKIKNVRSINAAEQSR
jgi:hypothetical protein